MTPTDHGTEEDMTSRDGVTATSVPSLPADAADPVADELSSANRHLGDALKARDEFYARALAAEARVRELEADHVDLSPTTAGSAEGVKLDREQVARAFRPLLVRDDLRHRVAGRLMEAGIDQFYSRTLDDVFLALFQDEAVTDAILALAPTQEGDTLDLDKPISRPRASSGEPGYSEIISLFGKYGLGPPPVGLRDELVVAFQWARYGVKLSDRRASPAPTQTGEGQ